jgi:hypothetical protein
MPEQEIISHVNKEVIVLMCSLSYIFNLPVRKVPPSNFTFSGEKIDWILTIKNGGILAYRILLNYLLLEYLLLTLLIAGSAFEYYISEINARKIPDNL